ncbi:unnamed protein product, partial [Rotaria sp. Silwood1]
MRSIIKVIFAALLFANSISRAAGFPGRLQLRDDQHYDDLIASERQSEEGDYDQTYNELEQLISHLTEDDRQLVYTIIQLTALVESRSCIKDEEARNNFGNDLFNSYAKQYGMFRVEYYKLLDKIDKADQ